MKLRTLHIATAGLLLLLLTVYCNPSENSRDEALADYAETFNNQASQLIPMTPAINSFHARLGDTSFYIEVDMDTTIVNPDSLTPESVTAMLKESLSNKTSEDIGFAEALEATGMKLFYRCKSGNRTILEIEIDPKNLK